MFLEEQITICTDLCLKEKFENEVEKAEGKHSSFFYIAQALLLQRNMHLKTQLKKYASTKMSKGLVAAGKPTRF